MLSEIGRTVVNYRSVWNYLGALLAVGAGFSFLGVLTDPASGAGVRIVFVVSAFALLTVAVRVLMMRTIVSGSHLKSIGFWGIRNIEVVSAKPKMLEVKIVLVTWAPLVVPVDGEPFLISGLAGYSLSQSKVNGRVARICREINEQIRLSADPPVGPS